MSIYILYLRIVFALNSQCTKRTKNDKSLTCFSFILISVLVVSITVYLQAKYKSIFAPKYVKAQKDRERSGDF